MWHRELSADLDDFLVGVGKETPFFLPFFLRGGGIIQIMLGSLCASWLRWAGKHGWGGCNVGASVGSKH